MTHPIGITFASFANLGPAAGAQAAAWATELGYSSFWVAETVGAEAFATLSAIGSAQPSLDLGTGVLALQLRTPGVTAMGAATLQSLHPDRDILLGVGISSPAVVSRWHGATYGDRPLAQVREYLTVLRECLSGEKVTFQGDFYEVRGFRLAVRLGERRPRIILAGLNPRMLELGGELADGVLLNYLPASHVPWSVEQVRKGGPATIYSYVHVGVTEREPHLDHGRRDIFSYAVVDSYARNFIRAGFADEVAEIRERHAAGDRDGAVAAVSDAMVDAIDVLGDADLVRRTVQSHLDGGVDVPVVMPMPWGADRMQIVHDTMAAAITAR